MLNYKTFLEKSNSENEYNGYNYWYKKFIEETIKGLNNLYDKSMHIFNCIFNLNCKEKFGFNCNVLNELKKTDIKIYNELYLIYEDFKDCMNGARDNIEHNNSKLFPHVIYIPRRII